MTAQAAERFEIPTNPRTGEPYLYAMQVGSRTVYADSNEELVSELLGEDYLEETDSEVAFEFRLAGAISIATAIQESIVAAAARRGDLSADENEDTWDPLLQPRESADAPGGTWNHRVPLVLVRCLFAPYDNRDVPQGNILWIDPIDDVSLLESVQDSGLIRLIEHDEIADPERGDGEW